MRFVFMQQKGGAGKTTLAINTACELATQGHKTILVDLDPQGSIIEWFAHAQHQLPEKLTVAQANSPADLDNLEGFKYIVIDTAGRLSADALPLADVVLIPISPSPLDVWAAADTVALVKGFQEKKNAGLKAAIVINRVQRQTVLGKESADVLKGYGLPVLKQQVGQRAVFLSSLAKGKSAISTAGEARTEVQGLVKELLKFSK